VGHDDGVEIGLDLPVAFDDLALLIPGKKGTIP